MQNKLKMSKAQQTTVLEVLIASLILGAAVVTGIWAVRYIIFNTKVITAKDESIRNYETAIINVGVCKDSNNDGKISDEELNNCSPNELANDDVQSSLRHKIFDEMAVNKNLEAVARKSLPGCTTTGGQALDFTQIYQDAQTDEERARALSELQLCSALRVVPDALPAQENNEAAMASLNQLSIVAQVEPTSLASGEVTQSAETTDETEASEKNYDAKPIAIAARWEDIPDTSLYALLTTTERSIRAYDVKTATIEWVDNVLTFQGNFHTYYEGDLDFEETTKIVKASEEKK